MLKKQREEEAAAELEDIVRRTAQSMNIPYNPRELTDSDTNVKQDNNIGSGQENNKPVQNTRPTSQRKDNSAKSKKKKEEQRQKELEAQRAAFVKSIPRNVIPSAFSDFFQSAQTVKESSQTHSTSSSSVS